MPSRWIEFIKDWAKSNNIAYGCALSDPDMKEAYHKKYNTKQHQTKTREMKDMAMEDVRSKAVEQKAKKFSALNYNRPSRLPAEKPAVKIQAKVEEKRPAGYEIEIIDEDGLETIFDKNYDAGDDLVLIPVKTPNGNYYNEDDWDTLTGSSFMKKNTFADYAPLARYLKKKGVLKFTATK